MSYFSPIDPPNLKVCIGQMVTPLGHLDGNCKLRNGLQRLWNLVVARRMFLVKNWYGNSEF